MSESLAIQCADLSATIDPQGAWLTSFKRGAQDMFFPKSVIELSDGSQKVRGGCHVCLPSFGPGGSSGLPQHGFGRDEAWDVIELADPASVTLENRQKAGEYAGLVSQLRYTIRAKSLIIELIVQNTSNSEFRIAPGFHPYFMAGESDLVKIDDVAQDITQLSTAIELAAQPEALTIGNSTFGLLSANLPKWILWTDQLGEYICVEPTYAGFSFEHSPEESKVLLSDHQAHYSITISII